MRQMRVSTWLWVMWAVVMVLACAHLGMEEQEPTFGLRASKLMAFPETPIMLTASLGGEEVERLYCPRVVWEWPDGTESTEESECPPFADRGEYPRRWTKWIALAVPGEYPVKVRWEMAGRRVGRAEVLLRALGGE